MRLLTRFTTAVLRFRIRMALRSPTSSDVLNHYVVERPTAQNAIDSVPGWTSAMPPESGLRAGKSPLFADTRIAWLIHSCIQVAGKSVLELGPLEGLHTYMLDRAGVAAVDAIEANALAFVRCLITKEVLKIGSANFHLGDFTKWLETTDKRYDLVIASGVLYHSDDPVHLLELLAERADAIFLWTHYFDEGAMPKDDLRRLPFSETIKTKISHGVTMRLFERTYNKAWRDLSFCGGLQDKHYWIERGELLALLSALGFSRVLIANEQPDHENGPSFSVFAERAAVEVPETPPDHVVVGEVEAVEVEADEAEAVEASLALTENDVSGEVASDVPQSPTHHEGLSDVAAAVELPTPSVDHAQPGEVEVAEVSTFEHEGPKPEVVVATPH